MSTTLLTLHPDNPQPRLLKQIASMLQDGAVIAYPTSSGFALGCRMGLREPLNQIKRIRDLDDKHNFTLICRDLSEISTYARVSNTTYRLLKQLTPGPYTFILKASQQVPKLVMQARKKTIGIRVPEEPFAHELTGELDTPLLSSTLILPTENEPLSELEQVENALDNQVDYIIDCGQAGFEPTTVLDCTNDQPQILRYGGGDVSWLED